MPYSVTKPFAAVCLLLLVDRGLVDLDAPMQAYWPELVAPASVRQVLSHQAGIVAIDEPLPTEAFYDWDRLCTALAAQEPQWPPGEAHGESALFFGHLVGEVVRRVDGRSLGTFLREEVCGPRGLDFAIGLGRASKLAPSSSPGSPTMTFGATSSGHERRCTSEPPTTLGSLGPGGGELDRLARRRDPGHQRARHRSRCVRAVRLAARLDLAVPVAPRRDGCSSLLRPDEVMGAETAWGLGVATDADGFGMGGTGGNLGWASTAGGYAYAFVTGSVGTHERSDLGLGLPPLE